MIRHNLLIFIVALLLLANIILAAKLPKHMLGTTKHYTVAPIDSCITIAYGPCINEGSNLLDLYLPENELSVQSDKSQKSYIHDSHELYPLIVFIHGGAWQIGDKSQLGFQEEFSRHGYALASINYRLTDIASYPAQIEDCRSALRWLCAHAKLFKIDPNYVGVWGVSAGGHLAALLGTTDETTALAGAGDNHLQIKAVCDWCGPTDLSTIAEQAGSHYKLAQAVSKLLRGSPSQQPDVAKDASPTTHVHKGLPPFLIMHGDIDPIVPIEQSKELDKTLKSAGVSSQLEIISGAGHNFDTRANRETVLRFFDRNLKKPDYPSH